MTSDATTTRESGSEGDPRSTTTGSTCQACGMLVEPARSYHPYAACLMFKACRNGNTVDMNLQAVVEYGKGLATPEPSAQGGE